MYSGSSRNDNRPNPDGTVNSYCTTCGEFVSRTTVRMRVQCELCRRAETGEPLTPEMIELYRQSKEPVSSSIRMLVLPDVPGKEEKKFRFSSMAGTLLEAVGIKRKKAKELPSQKASKAQRRGRIFEGVELGNISQVDDKLKGDK